MPSVILPRPDHPVSRKNIHPDALKVLYRLTNKGFTTYLVGGSVRDLILGKVPKDFDVSTSATPQQVKKLFRNCFLIGRRFRLAHIRFGDHIIETSTFRRTPDTDDTSDDLYVHRDNCYGTPEEDALRRDFTINALFYEIRNFSIIDHVGGLADLAERRIRCIGNPAVRFQEDPVRMLRAIRFAAKMDFHIEPKTYNALVRHHSEITKASPPRLFEEMLKFFIGGHGQKACRLLYKTGLLHDLMPEIAEFLDYDHGHDSVFWQWIAGIDALVQKSGRASSAVIFAALFSAPVERVRERYVQQEGRVRSQQLFEELLEPVCERMSMPRALRSRVIQIMLWQSRFEPEKRKRFSRRGFVAQDAFADTLALYEIGLAVRGGAQDTLAEWNALHAENLCEQPEERKTSPRRPPRKRPPRRQKT